MIIYAYIGATLSVALITVALAYGMSQIGKAGMEAMARQPEIADKIEKAMMIPLGFMEGAALFAILVCLLVVILK